MKLDKTLFTVDDFLFEPHQRARVSLPARIKKGSKNETQYEQEHIDMFAIEGWPWPPSEEAMQQTCGDLSTLTQRSREIVYFANMKWDFPDSVDVQFIDANCSLDRLVRVGRSPWTDTAPLTLVGSTQLVMRRRGGFGQKTVRYILGHELLLMQGWAVGDFKGKNFTEVDNKTLCSLAGNAFSLFACGPLLLASLAMMPAASSAADMQPAAPPQVAEAESVDSDSDCNSEES